MTWAEALRSALGNLSRHKMRTALTMLGMVFGVGAVIAMLSIGAGAEQTALEAIERLGVRNVIVRAKDLKDEELQEVRKKSVGVSFRDAEAITEAVADVETVLPRIEIKVYNTFSYGGKTKPKVYGVSSRQPEVSAMRLSAGRFFDAVEEADHAQVCVIGDGVRRDLFGFEPAIGKELKVNDVWLEVIGVLEAESASGGGSLEGVSVSSTENQIILPISTALRKFDRPAIQSPLDELVVVVRQGAASPVVGEVIRPLLDRLHGGAEDYEIVVPEALLAQSRKTQRLFNLVMGSIAGISLLVGGIGIMNIMLASVLERTREIGVRRALGARRRDIHTQFVIESFAISALGGIAGIVIGIALARTVAAFAEWPTVVSIWSIVLATGVSVAVGWVSGIYPATRAAKLDPIEALRYE
jgi:putative ABC transport system permease protein